MFTFELSLFARLCFPQPTFIDRVFVDLKGTSSFSENHCPEGSDKNVSYYQ